MGRTKEEKLVYFAKLKQLVETYRACILREIWRERGRIEVDCLFFDSLDLHRQCRQRWIQPDASDPTGPPRQGRDPHGKEHDGSTSRANDPPRLPPIREIPSPRQGKCRIRLHLGRSQGHSRYHPRQQGRRPRQGWSPRPSRRLRSGWKHRNGARKDLLLPSVEHPHQDCSRND